MWQCSDATWWPTLGPIHWAIWANCYGRAKKPQSHDSSDCTSQIVDTLNRIYEYNMFYIWFSRGKQIIQYKHDIWHVKSCLLVMHLFLHCAFSCASSTDLTVCRNNCTGCRQKVSRRCVKACDTSKHGSNQKRSCTAYMQTVFLRCVWSCAFSVVELESKNSYTAHTWKPFLLNGWSCVFWGY